MKKLILFLLLSAGQFLYAQQLGKLTVEKIMRDTLWIGASPWVSYWSNDGDLLFRWNPEKKISDSVYYINKNDLHPKKSTWAIRQKPAALNVTYNSANTAYVYVLNGDIYLVDVKTGKVNRVTQTTETESNPSFVMNDSRIVYTRNTNVYAWDISSGSTIQLTNFQKSPAESRKENLSQQELWLKNDQLRNMDVLRTRKQKKDSAESARNALPKEKDPRPVYYEDKFVTGITVSPDARFITYRLFKQALNARATIIPDYVTESGFTQDIAGRTKVGAPFGTSEMFIYDRERDTVIPVKAEQLPGIMDAADYIRFYKMDTAGKKQATRQVSFFGPYWNRTGTRGVVEIYSADNKDRWIALIDPVTAKLKILDRQRDEAWIGGPGTTQFARNENKWINDSTYWFQSEASGYSHLYKVNVNSGIKTQLTSGNYEVQKVELSKGKKYFYITTNEVHPGEQQFYWLPVNGGKAERITTMTGANEVSISPDEKYLAVRYSYSNKPWELYWQENKPGSKAIQVTDKAQSEEFKSYPWIDPEVITFTASDGANVYARLFRPKNPNPLKPAVVFVHGAGYLQNAHKWWSSYFREYMFHNLLAENGYTVLDIDYRGSAGYGRNWRTGIYRYMGGKDLSDQVDGAKYLVEKLGVDPKRIGIYGGSYGGFITLMAMFTKPGVFAAGAGLRSVTDWANYNHGYTSNILNEPYTDSIAYKKSSPIYYAEGLKGALLMCHGMVDVNVHFQDIVMLTQRLIELKKENWELAVYPMEDHGFVEPTSWMDEYKRIFKLFETNLKK
jgi:dipeptidyl aminopeptidase/acylaminoacyl peptidase